MQQSKKGCRWESVQVTQQTKIKAAGKNLFRSRSKARRLQVKICSGHAAKQQSWVQTDRSWHAGNKKTHPKGIVMDTDMLRTVRGQKGRVVWSGQSMLLLTPTWLQCVPVSSHTVNVRWLCVNQSMFFIFTSVHIKVILDNNGKQQQQKQRHLHSPIPLLRDITKVIITCLQDHEVCVVTAEK